MKADQATSFVGELEALLGRGDFATARRLVEARLHDPQLRHDQAHALLGKLALQTGDRGAARSHLERAMALGVADVDAMALLGQLVLADEPERALALLRAAVIQDPAAPRPRLALGAALEAGGRLDEAAVHYRAATAARDFAGAAFAGLVRLAVALGDEAGALAAAQQLAACESLAPAEAIETLGALIDHPLQPGPADALLTRLEALGPPGPGPSLPLLRVRRAVALRDIAAALTFARQAVAAAPADPTARRILGEVLLRAGLVDEAIEVLRAAVAESAAPPETALALADGYRHREQPRQAAAVLATLCERHPDHAGAWLERAHVLAEVGREDEAQAAMARAMALDPIVDAEAGKVTRLLREALAELPTALAPVLPPGPFEIRRVRFGHNALLFQLDGPRECLFVKLMLPGMRSERYVQETAELLLRVRAALDRLPHPPLTVPRPLQAPDGRLAFPAAGGVAVVLEDIGGASLRRDLPDPRAQVSPAHAQALGVALGQLHGVLAGIPASAWERRAAAGSGMRNGLNIWRPWVDNRSSFEHDAVAWGLAAWNPAATEAIASHVGRLLPAVRGLFEALPECVVHGDFAWHNATWDGPRVVGIVDFDYADRDLLVVDLCTAIHRTAFDWRAAAVSGDARPRPDIARAIAAGYEAVRGDLAVPQLAALAAAFEAVRVQYYLSMARAAAPPDPRVPRTYAHAARTLDILRLQLDWMQRNPPLPLLLGRG